MNVTKKLFHEYPNPTLKNPPTLDWFRALAVHLDQVAFSLPSIAIFRRKLDAAVLSKELIADAVEKGDDFEEKDILNMLQTYLIGNHEALADIGVLSRAYWKHGYGEKIIGADCIEISEWIDNSLGPLTVCNSGIDTKVHYVEYRTLAGMRIRWHYRNNGDDIACITYESPNGCNLYAITFLGEQTVTVRLNNNQPVTLSAATRERLSSIIRVMKRCNSLVETDDHHVLKEALPAFLLSITDQN